MPTKYLIVEGMFDQQFYQFLLAKLGIDDVEVKIPSSFGGHYNGKHNAIELFKLLTKQLFDGSASKIGLIIDADFTCISNQGCRNTIDFVHSKLRDQGFDIKNSPATYSKGIFFKNDALGSDVALWIMPDNSSEGYLEYLLCNALCETKQAIVSEAKRVVETFSTKEFQSHHTEKANLAVAMAMLPNPGRNISHLVGDDILGISANRKLETLKSFLTGYFA